MLHIEQILTGSWREERPVIICQSPRLDLQEEQEIKAVASLRVQPTRLELLILKSDPHIDANK